MKSRLIDLLSSAFGQQDEKFRQKFYIFIICLVISIIIWFTIKLSDEYDTVIQMPVTFTNIPRNKVLTFVSDSVLQVELLEKGSNLFRMFYLKEIPAVSISLRFLPVYPVNGVYQGIITPSLLINEIEREQDLLGKIISISPDTLYLTLEQERSRKLPVKADFDLSFEKQFMRYGTVTFSVDCVMVRGPQKIVDQLDSVSLGKIRLESLNQNYTGTKSFPSDSLFRNLIITPDLVTYTIPVEKYTEAEMEVPLRIVNGHSLKVKTFPDKVKVYYTVALKDYSRVEAGMIQAVVDMSEIDVNMEDRIRVSLESFPAFIRINKIEPEKVEYILIK